jgi:hypothetical protein
MTLIQLPASRLNLYQVRANPSGDSYFSQDTALSWQPCDSGDWLSRAWQSQKCFFHHYDENYYNDWHCVGKDFHNLVIFLSGRQAITVSDGSQKIFAQGDAVIFADTHGQGHQTQGLSSGLSAVIQLTIPPLNQQKLP